ncbi:hypothetical protein [Saccharolobus islandicus]|uniref:hypothetical protein n=1 Tax=Saccharolobus islandicus TaxID=43080 RepID=UPI00037B9859|nr:hypothetical protein [Sulfolobus islandicus]
MKELRKKPHAFDIKKYLSSLLPQKLKEEFLSRVNNIKEKAEIFAYFIVFCREYGLILDFDKIREQLGISKITLRKARKKILMRQLVKPWERLDSIFFEVADKLERKDWLAAVLLFIEYQRRGNRISIKEIKKHLEVKFPISNNYSIFRLRNGKNCLVVPYPAFSYLVCPHGLPSKIDYRSGKFTVRHLNREKKFDYCFVVSRKKIDRILSKMELHYEAVKNSTQNAI